MNVCQFNLWQNQQHNKTLPQKKGSGVSQHRVSGQHLKYFDRALQETLYPASARDLHLLLTPTVLFFKKSIPTLAFLERSISPSAEQIKRTAALMGTANWVFNLCIPQIPYSSKLQMTFARLWIMVFTRWGHFVTDLSKAFDPAAHKAFTLNNLSYIKERRKRHKTLDINQLTKGP